jgi:hypothetical protein
MKLLNVIPKGKCEYCEKELEVWRVKLSSKRVVLFCLDDLAKQSRLYLKETSDAGKK